MLRTTDAGALKISGPAVVAIFVALLAGCAGADEKEDERVRPGQTDLLVEKVVIAGTEPFPSRRVRRGLATQPDPGGFLATFGADRSYFNVLDWKKDLDRIRTFFERRGYFNVTIVRENVLRNPEEGTVRLEVKLDPGRPSKLARMDIQGLGDLPAEDRKAVTDNLPLAEETIFTEMDYSKAKELIAKRLERRGYAYTEVSGRAVVYPHRREVHVRLITDPGPKAVFGEIDIRGAETIPEKFVREALTMNPGDPYSSQALQRTQQSIYGMNVFSLVRVQPAHEFQSGDSGEADAGAEGIDIRRKDETDGGVAEVQRATGISTLFRSAQQSAEKRASLDREVSVVVEVKEARHWNVRIGAGVAAERQRQDTHLELDVSSENFLGGLRKLNWTTAAGYAWAPGILFSQEGAARRGVILSSDLEFVQPRLFDPKTNFRFSPAIERDVQIGYTLLNPSARIGIDRSFFDHLTVGIGYRIAYYRFDDIDPAYLEAEDVPSDLRYNFQEEFILETLEQTATLDYLDNPVNPRSGFRAQLSVGESSNYLFNGEFDFIKTSTAVEGYIPTRLITEETLALRAQLGAIYNVEPTGGDQEAQSVPTTSRFYSGGKGSFRGMGRRSVSLYRVQDDAVPIGALTQFEASVEPRFKLVSNLFGIGDLWGATFLDMATVHGGQFLHDTPAAQKEAVGVGEMTSSMLYGVGTGLWWGTPVGPVRIDGAYTLSDVRTDARFRKCANDNPTSGDENCQKLPISADPIQQDLGRFNFMIGIGHSF